MVMDREAKAALALAATTDELEAGRILSELLDGEQLTPRQRAEIAALAAAEHPCSRVAGRTPLVYPGGR